MEKENLKNVLVLDVETTGLPPKKAKWDEDYELFPHIAQISWSINGRESDYIIKPDGWTIPKEASDIHGITTEMALEKGVPIEDVITEFVEDCAGAYLIAGHNIYFDVSTIKANIIRAKGRNYYDEEEVDDALYKGKRIDTMYKTIKFVGACYKDGRRGKYPKLEELYRKLFNEDFNAHNSMDDVRAVVRCLPVLVEKGIIKLERKVYE